VTKVQKISHRGYLRHLLPALLLAALACLAAASPALALDLNPANYFQLTYDPITFDKTAVGPGGAFHTTITGRATCYKNIPIPVSRAEITSRVVARSPAGASYTLNSGFTIEINPFPTKQGDTYDIDVPLTMQFPPEATPGQYQVVWQLVKATARILITDTDVTGSLPAEQAMGNITVAAASPPTPPATTPAPSPTATIVPPNSVTLTVPPPPPPFTVGPTGPPVFTGWFIVLVVAGAFVVAAAVAVVLIIVLRRRRD
jgi:hypothetical protein